MFPLNGVGSLVGQMFHAKASDTASEEGERKAAPTETGCNDDAVALNSSHDNNRDSSDETTPKEHVESAKRTAAVISPPDETEKECQHTSKRTRIDESATDDPPSSVAKKTAPPVDETMSPPKQPQPPGHSSCPPPPQPYLLPPAAYPQPPPSQNYHNPLPHPSNNYPSSHGIAKIESDLPSETPTAMLAHEMIRDKLLPINRNCKEEMATEAFQNAQRQVVGNVFQDSRVPSHAQDSQVSGNVTATKEKKVRTPDTRGLLQRPSGNWSAQVYCFGKRRWIGTFGTSEKATRARVFVREKVNAHEKIVNEQEAQVVFDSILDEMKKAFQTVSCRGSGKRRNRSNVAETQGVTLKPSGKWQAQLWYADQSRYLGVFDTSEQATQAYKIARTRLKGSGKGGASKGLDEKTAKEAVEAVRKEIEEQVVKGGKRS